MTCSRCCTVNRMTSIRSLIASASAMVLLFSDASAASAAPVSEARPAAQEAAPVTSSAPLPTLEGLLRRFAAMPGLSARFREEKHMALLAAPLINEGTIHFSPPGRLVRHTTAPMRSSVLIDGERLLFGDARGIEVIRLRENPAIALFVASFVKIFAGDEAALTSMYSMSIAARPELGAEGWGLTLRPRVAPMDTIVARIEIAGDGVVVREMRVVELSGDETRTTFFEVNPARSFSAEEAAALFQVEGRR
jgi:hypothetical protein